MYDVYVASNWAGIPILVTSDAVLHIYHVLYDQMLAQIEAVCFIDTLDVLSKRMIEATEELQRQTYSPLAQEAVLRYLAFLYMADQLFGRNTKPVLSEVDTFSLQNWS